MNSTPIDWHRVAIIAVGVAIGIVGLVIAWKVTKLLLKLFALLVIVAIGGALAFWWHSAR